MENQQVGKTELVNSFSKHAKLSNNYMLGLLLCSVVYVMNTTSTGKIEFPYIGGVEIEHFQLISMIIISCLMILFSSVHLMALRIREYYNLFYNEANDKDYFDLIVEPTIFRMAPISWMIKNRNVFFVNIGNSKDNWKKFELIVYYFLKVIVLLISYVFPATILIKNIILSRIIEFNYSSNLILHLFIICLIITSLISFCIVFVNELTFIFRMPGKIFTKKIK